MTDESTPKEPIRYLFTLEAHMMRNGNQNVYAAVCNLKTGEPIYENAWEVERLIDGIWQATAWYLSRSAMLKARAEKEDLPPHPGYIQTSFLCKVDKTYLVSPDGEYTEHFGDEEDLPF